MEENVILKSDYNVNDSSTLMLAFSILVNGAIRLMFYDDCDPFHFVIAIRVFLGLVLLFILVDIMICHFELIDAGSSGKKIRKLYSGFFICCLIFSTGMIFYINMRKTFPSNESIFINGCLSLDMIGEIFGKWGKILWITTIVSTIIMFIMFLFKKETRTKLLLFLLMASMPTAAIFIIKSMNLSFFQVLIGAVISGIIIFIVWFICTGIRIQNKLEKEEEGKSPEEIEYIRLSRKKQLMNKKIKDAEEKCEEIKKEIKRIENEDRYKLDDDGFEVEVITYEAQMRDIEKQEYKLENKKLEIRQYKDEIKRIESRMDALDKILNPNKEKQEQT